MKIITGERIGRQARLKVGCSAVIYDRARQKLLLTRRADNQDWCLPSGGMDPGEHPGEACQREVWEETGLRVRITRLLGVYTNPDRVVEYSDGNRWQILALSFEAEVTGGALALSDETLDAGFFPFSEIGQLKLLPGHVERIRDALADAPAPHFT